jgi:hypothetical protein
MGNTALAATQQAQTATIKGDYTMIGGVIGFLGPTQIGDDLVWSQFKVDGNVYWFSGQYNPGLDCRPDAQANTGNKWVITGMLNIIPIPQISAPSIVPVPQFGQPSGTWDVIVMDGMGASVQGYAPEVPQGWTLLPVIQNGVVKGYRVEK